MYDPIKLKQIGIRALRTMVQTGAGTLGTAGLFWNLDWCVIASTTLLAGISCVLMNFGKYDRTKKG